ncbi:MAG: CoA transferase [Flavobacteriales bacterium]|jgi:crotonobetainyl-CoA:carnitine CoA-transferase CaiB-like acyl-CoA transferase|nr:CoA transferase [Flavobacteriales bacterium]
MNQPLAGYRILDFTKLLPGPLATMWMAQQGAEVIKVESPKSPDPVRWYPPMEDGVSVFYNALNAGKKSISIDYREEEGREAILRLVENADVVIEQFRPGVLEAFGLGFDELKKHNENIILVSITGYGQTGEMANTPGHDINYLSYSGMLDAQHDKEGNPIISAAQIADVAGGSMMALNATTSALLHRERTGQGQHVDVSMTHNVSVLQSMRIAEEKGTGTSAGHLSGKLASYNVYRCADGRHVALGALEPKFWQKFCNLVGHPEWGGRVMETELIGEVAELFATHPMQHWTDELENEDVCLSPVLTVMEAMNHDLFKQGFPASFGDKSLPAAPELGSDNDELLE